MKSMRQTQIMASDSSFSTLAAAIRACTACAQDLRHEPRPVFRGTPDARILIVGQAPGTRVHATGIPFNDASGTRLRQWLGVESDFFYDERHVAIVPMGFCFPGQDAQGGDLPPRPECARLWRARLLSHFTSLRLTVLVGRYAQQWHLGAGLPSTLTETVRHWRDYAPRQFPLPHPSWRNNGWLKRNPWFEKELLPALRERVREVAA